MVIVLRGYVTKTLASIHTMLIRFEDNWQLDITEPLCKLCNKNQRLNYKEIFSGHIELIIVLTALRMFPSHHIFKCSHNRGQSENFSDNPRISIQIHFPPRGITDQETMEHRATELIQKAKKEPRGVRSPASLQSKTIASFLGWHWET